MSRRTQFWRTILACNLCGHLFLLLVISIPSLQHRRTLAASARKAQNRSCDRAKGRGGETHCKQCPLNYFAGPQRGGSWLAGAQPLCEQADQQKCNTNYYENISAITIENRISNIKCEFSLFRTDLGTPKSSEVPKRKIIF